MTIINVKIYVVKGPKSHIGGPKAHRSGLKTLRGGPKAHQSPPEGLEFEGCVVPQILVS